MCEVLKLKFAELRVKNVGILGYIEKEKKKDYTALQKKAYICLGNDNKK